MTVINYKSELNEHIFTIIYLIIFFNVSNMSQKDFENFLILGMIAIFPLSRLSRVILIILD
jgi:hypothetical protein